MTPSRIAEIKDFYEAKGYFSNEQGLWLLAEIERLNQQISGQAGHIEGLQKENERLQIASKGHLLRLKNRDEECDQLTAQLKERDEQLNRLTGMKFSDRMHAALKSRAETAEAQLKAREAAMESVFDDRYNDDGDCGLCGAYIYKGSLSWERESTLHESYCSVLKLKAALARLESPQ